jgi:protein PhnA
MALNPQLQNRSNNSCELCSNESQELKAYAVPPKNNDSPDNEVVLCSGCYTKINSSDYSDTNHWRCLTGSIWSEVPAVQALSYKILGKLNGEAWATEAIESVYLDESVIEWANAEDELEASKVIHKDSYGVVLETGDSVILTQNLNVKGANFIAPKGTMVRKIRLVPDNAEQIEGKIEGDTIVILTKYVRKSV